MFNFSKLFKYFTLQEFFMIYNIKLIIIICFFKNTFFIIFTELYQIIKWLFNTTLASISLKFFKSKINQWSQNPIKAFQSYISFPLNSRGIIGLFNDS